MAVTQEARRSLRPQVAAAHPGLPYDNDNAAPLMKAMGSLDLRSRLPDVRCPVLVTYGSRDAVMVVGARMLAQGIAHAGVHELADVGHEPFIEAPAETFTVLWRFFEDRP